MTGSKEEKGKYSVVLFFERNDCRTFDCTGHSPVFEEYWQALETYANTPNPASRLISADDMKTLTLRMEETKAEMSNILFVKEHIDPYL